MAMEACLASRDANICLIPEFEFELYGKYGLLEYIYHRIRLSRNVVIVLAEGAYKSCIDVDFNEKENYFCGYL